MTGVDDSDAMLHAEGARFARYLLGCRPGTDVLERYADAIRAGGAPQRRRDAALLRFSRARPRAIGLLDAGLAVADPHSELRRRLYLMFAILESSPEHHDLFLPAETPPWYPLTVAYAGLRGGVKAAAGIVLVGIVVR